MALRFVEGDDFGECERLLSELHEGSPASQSKLSSNNPVSDQLGGLLGRNIAGAVRATRLV